MHKTRQLDDDPLWYKDAVIYEVHVRAFFDSNGDGMGDFAGLTQKLDYLQDLGVTAIWLLALLPFARGATTATTSPTTPTSIPPTARCAISRTSCAKPTRAACASSPNWC